MIRILSYQVSRVARVAGVCPLGVPLDDTGDDQFGSKLE
jgi:hypothetical protein